MNSTQRKGLAVVIKTLLIPAALALGFSVDWRVCVAMLFMASAIMLDSALTFCAEEDELKADFTKLLEDAIFSRVWDDIYEKRGYGWDANPFVWVIEFERTEASND